MKLLVGLGNPGSQYKKTRHNIGFMCLDQFQTMNNLTFSTERKFQGDVVVSKNYILLKPNTYMNLSGEAVRKVMDYYKIDIDDVLIIHDDLDLCLGKLRLRAKGSSGGHNGLKSIIAHTNTQTFKRVKFGIDKTDSSKTKTHVLGKFTKKELELINQSIDQVQHIMNDFINGIEFTMIMNQYN